MTGTGVMLPLGISSIERSGAVHGESAGLTSMSNQMGLLGEIRGKGAVLGVLKEVSETYPGKGKRRVVI